MTGKKRLLISLNIVSPEFYIYSISKCNTVLIKREDGLTKPHIQFIKANKQGMHVCQKGNISSRNYRLRENPCKQ